MKRIFFFFVLTTLFSVAVYSQSGPVMKFESKEVDYGVIVQGSNPLRVFKFTNAGKEPLIITAVNTSCGCTVPKYPMEPILPGETGNIDVSYDTNRIGVFQKSIHVSTNEGKDPHMLLIKGTVNAKPSQEGIPTSKRGFGSN